MKTSTEMQYLDEPGFWDDDTNKVIVGAIFLILLYLTVKYKPWRILLPVATAATSVASTTVSTGVVSASVAGLSVGQIVKLL